MSEERLKHCPFCGSLDIRTQSGSGVDLTTQYNGRYVFCGFCGVFKQVKNYSEWNQRPETNAISIIEKRKKRLRLDTFSSSEICDLKENKAQQKILAEILNQIKGVTK